MPAQHAYKCNATRQAQVSQSSFGILSDGEPQPHVGCQLALSPPWHRKLGAFRVLVIDSQPLVPRDSAVRGAINRVAERLAKAGARFGGAAPELYEETKAAVAALKPGDASLTAERARGLVMSHRDWLVADLGRGRLREQ
jgi:amidase